MSNNKRRYRVTKPGRPEGATPGGTGGPAVRRGGPRARNTRVSIPKAAEPPRVEQLRAGSEVTRGGRKYRIISTGSAGQVSGRSAGQRASMEQARTAGAKRPPMRSGRGDRRYKIISPGRPEAATPVKDQRGSERSHPRGTVKPRGAVRSRPVPGPAGPGMRTGMPPQAAAVVEAGALTEIDKAILVGLDKGPANIKIIAKRTKVTQSKLLPTVKKLTNQGLIESRRIGRVTKYRLSLKAEEMLHPRKFPMTLFKPARRRRGRRGGRRKLSQRQKVRRLDYGIAALIIIILVVMISLFWYLNTNISSDGSDNGSNQQSDDYQDDFEPVIIWNNEANEINRAYGNLNLNFSIYDRGERPSGLNQNSLKVQYGFASHRNLLEPNISNWTNIIPLRTPPHDIGIIINEDWPKYNGTYMFIRLSIWDNANNFESNTFKIFINI